MVKVKVGKATGPRGCRKNRDWHILPDNNADMEHELDIAYMSGLAEAAIRQDAAYNPGMPDIILFNFWMHYNS